MLSNDVKNKYPKYYKPVSPHTHVDIYLICKLFKVDDPSGALHHAIKKLLLSGVRTGGKSKVKDIVEARDALNRYLELNEEINSDDEEEADVSTLCVAKSLDLPQQRVKTK